MRVCPKCGHSDNPLWMNCLFKRDLQVMRIEDFEKEYPELALRLPQKGVLKEGQFWYKRSKMYVRRKEPSYSNQPFDEHFEAMSKRGHLSRYGNRRIKELKTQTKLFGENK